VTNEYSGHPLEERMRTYRARAINALKAAEASASEEVREHFVFIAVQWEELARNAELRLATSTTVPWIGSE